MNKRYIVIKESQTQHCCFEATVIDTHKSQIDDGYNVCESLWIEQAEMICDVLNKCTQGGGG